MSSRARAELLTRGVLSKDVPKRGGKEGGERLVRVLQPPVCACYRVRRGNEAHRQASVVKREMACDCSDAQGRPPATDQDTGRPLTELVPGDGGPELNSEGYQQKDFMCQLGK
ncbi:uncharacterized protein AAEQ78_008534 isoform 2-T6 [Lycaon pictus]